MKPVKFPQANTVFNAPPDVEGIDPLYVHDTGEAFVSCWVPTPEEREAIVAGAPVWLWVVARGQPPVSLSLDHPFEPAVEHLSHVIERSETGPVRRTRCGITVIALDNGCTIPTLDFYHEGDARKASCERCRKACVDVK